jgi:hypothetical protein
VFTDDKREISASQSFGQGFQAKKQAYLIPAPAKVVKKTTGHYAGGAASGATPPASGVKRADLPY